jgi:hypothetical protein
VNHWLGVVSRDHVQRGVALGIAQIGHGAKAGLARMRAGDGLVYYSSRISPESTVALKAFTAIGVVADDELWQLQADLDLTQGPNWGYSLRRGLVALSPGDFQCIAEAMGSR